MSADIQGRLLGLDVGDKRIGIAASDGLGLIASPLQTVHRKNSEIDLAKLKAIVSKEEVTGIVVGLPLNMDNTEGLQASKVRAFARQLESVTQLPVYFEDERLSTFSATELLAERGIKTGHNRDLVDMHAAAIILQSYLDRKR